MLCHCIPFTIPIAVAIDIPITIHRPDVITNSVSVSFSDCYPNGHSFSIPVPIIGAHGTNRVSISIARSRWPDPPARCRHVRPVLCV